MSQRKTPKPKRTFKLTALLAGVGLGFLLNGCAPGGPGFSFKKPGSSALFQPQTLDQIAQRIPTSITPSPLNGASFSPAAGAVLGAGGQMGNDGLNTSEDSPGGGVLAGLLSGLTGGGVDPRAVAESRTRRDMTGDDTPPPRVVTPAETGEDLPPLVDFGPGTGIGTGICNSTGPCA